MKSSGNMVKSVAIIGAGPSGKHIDTDLQRGEKAALLIISLCTGAIAAAALKAENYFDNIRVFERRETAGGTWLDYLPTSFPVGYC